MKRTGLASRQIGAPADVVFGVVTDIAGLPHWNARMTGVVETPAHLEAGAEWVVGFRMGGKRFNSRSVVLELDERRRFFSHRSKPDDQNPSSTVWSWTVTPDGDGSRVTLAWDLRPVTPVRRMFAAPLRAWQIPRTDAPASLAALARRCEALVRELER